MKTQHITIGNSFLSQGPSPKEQREAMEKRLAESAPEASTIRRYKP